MRETGLKWGVYRAVCVGGVVAQGSKECWGYVTYFKNRPGGQDAHLLGSSGVSARCQVPRAGAGV